MKRNTHSPTWTFSVVLGLLSELMMLFFLPGILVFSLMVYQVLSLVWSLALWVVLLLGCVCFLLKSKRMLYLEEQHVVVKNLWGQVVLKTAFHNITSIDFYIRFDGIYNVIEVFLKRRKAGEIKDVSFAVIPQKQHIQAVIQELKKHHVHAREHRPSTPP